MVVPSTLLVALVPLVGCTAAFGPYGAPIRAADVTTSQDVNECTARTATGDCEGYELVGVKTTKRAPNRRWRFGAAAGLRYGTMLGAVRGQGLTGGSTRELHVDATITTPWRLGAGVTWGQLRSRLGYEDATLENAGNGFTGRLSFAVLPSLGIDLAGGRIAGHTTFGHLAAVDQAVWKAALGATLMTGGLGRSESGWRVDLSYVRAEAAMVAGGPLAFSGLSVTGELVVVTY